MVAVVDDAHPFIDVLTDGSGTGCNTGDVLVVTMDSDVVVCQQVVTDVVDVLIVVLAIVAAAVFFFRHTFANGKPGGRGIQVPLVVDDFVDLVGDLCCRFATETSNNQFIIVIIARSLPILHIAIP